MTMNTSLLFTVGIVDRNLMHKILMAIHTGMLSHAPIAGFDLNRFVKIIERERQRMTESIVRFCHVFSDEIMRQVTVITHSQMVMAGLLPAVIIALHDITIGARPWVVAK